MQKSLPKDIFLSTRQQVQSPNKSTKINQKLSLPKLDCHRKARLSNVYCPSRFFPRNKVFAIVSVLFNSGPFLRQSVKMLGNVWEIFGKTKKHEETYMELF